MSALFTAFGIDWRLLVVQAINFGILLFVLFYFLYRPVQNILEERRRMVTKGVADAQAAEEKLRNAATEKEEIVSQAVLQSDELIGNARKQATEEERRILKEAGEKSFEIIAAAERRAEEEKTRVVKEAEREIARLIILGMEKTLRAK